MYMAHSLTRCLSKIARIAAPGLASVAVAIVAVTPAAAQLAVTPANASYDSIPWQYISARNYSWKAGSDAELTLRNPYDGGVVLKYRIAGAPSNADGCSAGTEPWVTLFRDACLTHDWHYDAPFAKAGFPAYSNGKSLGQDITDLMFYTDMLMLGKNTANSTVAAYSMYSAVLTYGAFRGTDRQQTILETGGVVAVSNRGGYVLRLRVNWVSPSGQPKSVTVDTTTATTAAVIPLSSGARNITVEATAIGGRQIFTRSFANAGMYAFTVGGTTLDPTMSAGLSLGVANAAKDFITGGDIPAGQRGIKFNNQGGYVASMTVAYFAMQNIGGVNVPLAKTLTTPQLSVGFTRPLIVPQTAPGFPIVVTINGVGTVARPVFQVTVPTDFKGEQCFKSWGTIFDAKGGKC